MKGIRPDHFAIVRRAKLNGVVPTLVDSVDLIDIGKFNATFVAKDRSGIQLFHGMLPLDVLTEIPVEDDHTR